MNFLTTLLFLSLTFFSAIADARWAEKDEAVYVVNFERTNVTVRKDGSATYVTERQVEIVKESGRTTQGLTRRTFNSSTGRFRILEAKTINEDRSIPVSKKDIETKPLASTGPGFDVFSQTTVAFPEVGVGSKLYLKTELVEKRARIPSVFFYTERVASESFQDFELNITSKAPLVSELYDPEGYFERTADAKSVRFKLRRPYFKSVMEEPDSLADGRSFVWLGASNLQDWSKFPKSTFEAYERDLHSPLPAKFLPILKKAEQATSDVERINLVTSELASALRYVGDWRALEGAWHPRGLTTIATTGFGDCKDFSVSTGAILRQLGFDVQVAWIGRGRNWIESPLTITTLEINHAILHVEKEGREYWIDPTNLTSFAQGIYADIENRRAYLITQKGLVEKRTPPMRSEESSIKLVSQITFNDTQTLKGQGSLSFAGRAAEQWTGLQLTYSKKALDYSFINWVTNTSQLETWKVGDYDLRSRIARDFDVTFDFTEHDRPQLTTAGLGYSVPPTYYVKNYQFRTEDRVAMPKISEPKKLIREVRFSGREILYRKDLKCSGESPWVDFSRSIRKESRELVLTDTIEVKMNYLPLKDLKTKEFAELQNNLLNCLQEIVLVFKD
jgi:hypothetical protein